jgi:hypothetical protein
VGDDNPVGQNLTCAPPSRAVEIRCTAMTYFNRHPSNATDSFLISISPGGSIGGRAKLPGSPASKSNAASISTFRVAESMGFRASFANVRSCCELAINTRAQRSSNFHRQNTPGPITLALLAQQSSRAINKTLKNGDSSKPRSCSNFLRRIPNRLPSQWKN